jgi:hypothetical protein
MHIKNAKNAALRTFLQFYLKKSNKTNMNFKLAFARTVNSIRLSDNLKKKVSRNFVMTARKNKY